MRDKILKMLEDADGFVSGQELCEKLGVSRTAVWKVIGALREEGYVIDSVSRRGYHLVECPDILRQEDLTAALTTRWMGRRDVYKRQEVYFLAQDQTAIRQELKNRNLVAFVANGAILPRESGVSDLPMKEAVPFQSPESLQVTLSLPHRGAVTGMGIPKGITLIAGGGYHGKSTLLQALERGVYNHVDGDGPVSYTHLGNLRENWHQKKMPGFPRRRNCQRLPCRKNHPRFLRRMTCRKSRCQRIWKGSLRLFQQQRPPKTKLRYRSRLRIKPRRKPHLNRKTA